jgi:hypothetical protein
MGSLCSEGPGSFPGRENASDPKVGVTLWTAAEIVCRCSLLEETDSEAGYDGVGHSVLHLLLPLEGQAEIIRSIFEHLKLR